MSAPRAPVVCSAAIILLAVAGGACHRAIEPLAVPGRSAVALTGGPNTSMIYVARTSEGLLAIDLGWWGSDDALERAVRTLDASVGDVRMAFLTHSHRDHVSAWRRLRHARFHVAADELPRLLGDTSHGGWVPRLADKLRRADLPRAGEIDVRTFASDTSFAFGEDTLRAYVVPGHTAGTAVYLFRGILFLGDAVTFSRRGGFAPAEPRMSDDGVIAAANLERLWQRLPDGVRYVCTAHARCARYTAEFLTDVAR